MTKLNILPPKIDTLYVSYPIDHLSLENQEHIDSIENVLMQFGILNKIPKKDSTIYDTGIGLTFYIGEKYKGHNHLQVKADGEYWITKNSFSNIKEKLKVIQEELGLIGVVQRIDIQQVIYSKDKKLKPFDVVPDFRKEKKHKMKTKGKRKGIKAHYLPSFNAHYNDLENKTIMTGFTTYQGRWVLKSYEKFIQVQQAYQKKEISKNYHEYWMNFIRENSVKSMQRLELKLFRENCKFAQALIFKEHENKETEIAQKVLAYWGKTHLVYNYNRESNEYDRLNKKWSELFFIEQHETFNKVSIRLGIPPNLKCFMTKQPTKRSLDSYIKSLAKSLIENGYSDLNFIKLALLEAMKEITKESKEEISDYQKTLMFYDTNKEEIEKIQNKVIGLDEDIKRIEHEINQENKEIEDSLMKTNIN